MRLARRIFDDAVTAVSLVDLDLSLRCHVVETLVRMNTGLEGRGPRGSVDGGAALRLVGDVDPVDEEGDGVLGAGVAAHTSGNALGGGSSHTSGAVLALDHPAVDLSVSCALIGMCTVLTSMWCELR